MPQTPNLPSSLHRSFLSQVEVCSKPSDDVFSASLGAQIGKMGEVSEKVSAIKDRDLDQHGKSLDDGAQLIAWVSVCDNSTTQRNPSEAASSVNFSFISFI